MLYIDEFLKKDTAYTTGQKVPTLLWLYSHIQLYMSLETNNSPARAPITFQQFEAGQAELAVKSKQIAGCMAKGSVVDSVT